MFYVYIIYRPDGRECYVGKGKGRRHLKHRWRSTNPHLANIYAQAGGDLPYKIVAKNLSEQDAFALEIKLIAQIGREPIGPLVNLTDGGEGPSGFKFPREVVEKLRIKNRGRVPWNKGLTMSEETRAKQAARKRGTKQSPEHVEARRRKMLALGPRPPEWGHAISRGKTGKLWSDENKAILKAANRSREPEVRARIRAGTLAFNAHKRWLAAAPVSPYSQWGDAASLGMLSFSS
jgi:hypothetical protein